MQEHLEGLPQAVRAIAEKFPACNCGDFSCCTSERTKYIMEKAVTLVTFHPRYAGDDGEELLWQDLANVAHAAISDRQEVVSALTDYVDAAIAELPPEERSIQ